MAANTPSSRRPRSANDQPWVSSPWKARWTIHSEYTVANTRPTAPSTAAHLATCQVPCRMRNSATKLPRPGRPSEASAKNSAVPPMRGATVQRPPILPMSLVWMRSCSDPTSRNNAPVLNAWHTISRMAPCKARVFQANTPSSTKPMWLTLV